MCRSNGFLSGTEEKEPKRKINALRSKANRFCGECLRCADTFRVRPSAHPGAAASTRNLNEIRTFIFSICFYFQLRWITIGRRWMLRLEAKNFMLCCSQIDCTKEINGLFYCRRCSFFSCLQPKPVALAAGALLQNRHLRFIFRRKMKVNEQILYECKMLAIITNQNISIFNRFMNAIKWCGVAVLFLLVFRLAREY